jgi:Uma2 family endonuclease
MSDAAINTELHKPETAGPMFTQTEDDERRYTYNDYKKWDDGVRREIIGGRVYIMDAPTMAAPSLGHQGILMALSATFYNYLVGKPCRVFPAPFDVRLYAAPDADDDGGRDREVVQPDISVICDRSKRRPEGCRGAPDLIVEILSPSNRSHDMLLKFNKYLEAGVREYWVIDPQDRILFVHTLSVTPKGNQYSTAVYGATDTVKVGIFEDCVIAMADIFAAGEDA